MQDITEYLDIANRIVRSCAFKTHKIKLLPHAITLNGWFFPAKKDIYAFGIGVYPMELFRINKAVLYDDVSNQGIVVKSNSARFL